MNAPRTRRMSANSRNCAKSLGSDVSYVGGASPTEKTSLTNTKSAKATTEDGTVTEIKSDRSKNLSCLFSDLGKVAMTSTVEQHEVFAECRHCPYLVACHNLGSKPHSKKACDVLAATCKPLLSQLILCYADVPCIEDVS